MSTVVIGTVKSAEMSRSNTSVRVNVDDRWYSSKKFELQGLVGKTISFVPSVSSHNGKTYLWINDFSVAGAASAPNQPAVAPSAPPQTAPNRPQATNGDRQACLPMTSNLVAHAISAGLIKSPDELSLWATKAFDAAYLVLYGNTIPGLSQSADPEFDDDIPF